jgi:hypothetical protein
MDIVVCSTKLVLRFS